MESRVKKRAGARGAVGVLCLLAVAASPAFAQWSAPPSASVIPAAQLLQPQDLNRILHGPRNERPLVLQVGSHVMFREAHIAGSEYAGPGSSNDGLNVLRNRVKTLPRATFIVLYCGCCPWDRCPNVGPAYMLLHNMGFTRVKVLYLPENFGTDWMNRGYPVAQGE